MKPKTQLKKRRFAARLLTVLLAVLLVSTLPVSAKDSTKVVRIGWYDSPFNIMDDLGRRSGYAYEYAQKVAVYAGWEYEYVEGSWPELMQMLKDGKIDLMTDVSYTRERDKEMLFSSQPMGAEDYYLFTTPGNTGISPTDYSTLNGKKIGTNKGSVQVDYFKSWAKTNNVKAELVELTGTESQNFASLVRGDIDMYLTLDSVANAYSAVPVCKIASSDFYFAVNKSRPDLMIQLNAAMDRIHDDNRFYNQQLYSKYLKASDFSAYFSNEECDWLKKHGAIKVGYQDNYLAFCAKDKNTGELTGALKDYLAAASDVMENAKPKFEPVAYPTSQAALEALKKGEIDCMFPANLTDYYGETKGYSITSPLMTTEMSAIVPESMQNELFKKERVTVAVNAGNPNYDMFLLDHFPEWRSIYFTDTHECLKAISQGKADCLLMSSFRVSDISEECDKYNLVALNADVKLDYCIAVRRNNAMLYSILNKMICAVPDATMSSALSRYTIEKSDSSKLMKYIRMSPGIVAAVLLPILVGVLLLMLYNSITHKRAKEHQELISATETDPLTGLYMKSYFFEYASRLYAKQPDTRMDAIVINVNRFHSVNALNGRVFGDRVLSTIGAEIAAFVEENGGIAGHTESDQFAIYCTHVDDYSKVFDRIQSKLDSLSSSANIRMRMGVMPWQKGTPPDQLVEHALVACNLARRLYKEHLIVFDENMRKMEEFEQQLLSDLRRAVDNRELVVYYQPKFDIQKETPQLYGAEALVRWQHPKYGLISSSDFIPLFERSGQIGIIDNYVWREAAKQAACWKEKYGISLPISINLSRLDIFDSTLEKTLEALVEEYSLSQSDIELEVTESAYTENADQLVDIIESLRKKGYKVQMDDFGSGYSSLNMLSSMPIDALKMDKAFISDINSNPKQLQLVELILDIADDLNLPVVAEGVETEEQMKLLQKLGCALVQGFYFSKPLPPEKYEARILDNYIK